jgi:hypothetical protein
MGQSTLFRSHRRNVVIDTPSNRATSPIAYMSDEGTDRLETFACGFIREGDDQI